MSHIDGHDLKEQRRALVDTVAYGAAEHRTGHSPCWIDRTGRTYGRLTALACVGHLDHSALWRCRCDCGRPDCQGEVLRTSRRLMARRGLWCGGLPRPRRAERPVAPPPVPASDLLLPEGVRLPWERPAPARALRDRELAAACARDRT